MSSLWALLCLALATSLSPVSAFLSSPLRVPLRTHDLRASPSARAPTAGAALGSRVAFPLGLRMEAEEQKQITPFTKDSEVLIVGASRGIGLELVRQVANKGSHVIATHRGTPPPDLKKLEGKMVTLIQCDVGDPASVQAAANSVKGKIRSGLTHIIHNAGILQGSQEDDPDQEWSKVNPNEMMDLFRINTVGPLLIVQAFGPLLAKPASLKGPKSTLPILAIISSKVGSVTDNASGGMYAYRASKSAANHVAKCLSIDMADEANVLLLHPGYVRTDMTEHMGFIDPPESVAGMISAIEATGNGTPFRWVDYKAEHIPF